MNGIHLTSARQRGLSLIELLVALAIGAVLIWGATQVYVDSRNAYTGNENVSRMQETGRYAMSVIESDLRLAGFWGLMKDSSNITGKAATTATVSSVASTAGAIICGNNFAVDLDNAVTGTNNQYTLPCNSLKDLDGNTWSAAAVTTSDVLVVRRAGIAEMSAAHANQLQVCSNRQSAAVFSDGTACPDSDPTTADSTRAGSLRNLEVYAYYVDKNSTGRTGVPSLRRKALCVGAGGAACATGISFIDEEVISGVEDMQVQFGISGGIAGGAATGVVTRYLNPGDAAITPGTPIVAVRLWLLVRSDEPEVGYVDGQTYQYGDRLSATGTTANLNSAANAGKAYVPSLSTTSSYTDVRRYRHILISRTIQLRNAAGT